MSAVGTSPSTFAEHGIVLHPRLLSAVQSGAHAIAPTPLLVRVLRRTAVDFADVIVDGRCANGTTQVGSAAAVWVHHNTLARAAASQVTASSSSTSSPVQPSATAAVAAASSSSRSPSFSSSPAASSGECDRPVSLYRTEDALRECQSLLLLHTFHCLLTVCTRLNTGKGGDGTDLQLSGDGRVQAVSVTARYWAPEVSILVAETEASAAVLRRRCKLLRDACGLRLRIVHVPQNEIPTSLVLPKAASAVAAGDTVTAKPESASLEGVAQEKEEGLGAEDCKSSTVSERDQPYLASLLITTAKGLLQWNWKTLLNTAVTVGVARNSADDAAKEAAGGDSAAESQAAVVLPEIRRVYPHIASIAVEEIGGASVTSPMGAEKAVQQWRELHTALHAAAITQNARCASAVHLQPHFLWICRGPVSSLPASLRQCLSRRSRRYYQLLPSTYISPSSVALMPRPHEGLSSPAESLGVRLVLSQSQADKEAQLRRIVMDRSGLYHRLLLLTHNKEVAQLSALLMSWGLSKDTPTSATAITAAVSSSASMSSDSVFSMRRMDNLASQLQCHTAFLQSCEAAEQVDVGAGDRAGAAPSPVVVTLVAWDALTSVDVMDVDVIIQCYPPQKSLTEQEWSEFIQVLHTTGDGEREVELSLRQNRNNSEDNIQMKLQQLLEGTTTNTSAAPPPSSKKGSVRAPSGSAGPRRPLPVLITMVASADLTLLAHFLRQYLYSGGMGTLTAAAAAAPLSSLTTVPGRPKVLEPVEHPLPVLDISPKHPYLIPLLCGHLGDVEWPPTALGSPPRWRDNGLDADTAVESMPTLVTGERVTVKRVLAAKLVKEQRRRDTASNALDSGATSPTSTLALLARGNTASQAAPADGSAPPSSSAGASGGRRGHQAERDPLSKTARGAGGSNVHGAAAPVGTQGGTTGSGSGGGARSNNNSGSGSSSGGGGGGGGPSGSRQRGTPKEAAAAAAATSQGSGNCRGGSSTQAANPKGRGGRENDSGGGGGASANQRVGSKGPAETGPGNNGGKHRGENGKGRAAAATGAGRTASANKVAPSSPSTPSTGAKDAGGNGVGEGGKSGGKRRSRNARGQR